MLHGRAFKFGDDISTDHIIPGRYAYLRSNLPELAKHVMEDADTTFVSRVNKGDIIVGGSNFGLGSSREHAPLIIKINVLLVYNTGFIAIAKFHRGHDEFIS